MIRDEKERLETALPDLAKLPLVLENLETLLNTHSGAVSSLRIGDTNYEADHVTVGLVLQFAGRPQRLFNILNDLEKFPHLILLNNIHWFQNNGLEPVLELDCNLVFFIPVQPDLLPD